MQGSTPWHGFLQFSHAFPNIFCNGGLRQELREETRRKFLCCVVLPPNQSILVSILAKCARKQGREPEAKSSPSLESLGFPDFVWIMIFSRVRLAVRCDNGIIIFNTLQIKGASYLFYAVPVPRCSAIAMFQTGIGRLSSQLRFPRFRFASPPWVVKTALCVPARWRVSPMVPAMGLPVAVHPAHWPSLIIFCVFFSLLLLVFAAFLDEETLREGAGTTSWVSNGRIATESLQLFCCPTFS